MRYCKPLTFRKSSGRTRDTEACLPALHSSSTSAAGVRSVPGGTLTPYCRFGLQHATKHVRSVLSHSGQGMLQEKQSLPAAVPPVLPGSHQSPRKDLQLACRLGLRQAIGTKQLVFGILTYSSLCTVPKKQDRFCPAVCLSYFKCDQPLM